MRALYAMKYFKPDLLHVTTPSFLVFPGILVARILGIPLVLSYHTHLPVQLKIPLVSNALNSEINHVCYTSFLDFLSELTCYPMKCDHFNALLRCLSPSLT